jgi:hypothetical protein
MGTLSKDRYRKPSSLGYLWFGQGRARMLEVCHNLGITDVCTCEEWDGAKEPGPWRMRPDSGRVGMRECKQCHHLLWPLSYVYDCDECTEPTLTEKFPVDLDEEFLCFDCALG